MNAGDFYIRWRRDYDFRTFINSTASLLLTLVFALYNGFLGISHSSPWHGSICVYYILLVFLRFALLRAEKKAKETDKREPEEGERLRLKTWLICSALLLLLNLCLIGPIALLVRQEKPVELTLVPAVAMAAYSFWKITLASINLVKRKKSANCLVKLLRSINFIDAIISIVTLQNTLIMVTDTGNKLTLLPFTAVTSGVMWLAIVALSVSSLIWGIRAIHNNSL